MTSSSTTMRHSFKTPPCESYCLSILQDSERPLMAACFTDLTTKIWDLNKLLVQQKGTLDSPDLVLKNSVELAPVEVCLAGRKLASSSIDGSLRLFDINVSNDEGGSISATPLVDPSQNDFSADGHMIDEGVADAYNNDDQGNLDMFSQNSTHSFRINPQNTDQLLSGQLSLQILEYQKAKKGFKVVHEIGGGPQDSQKFINCMDWSQNGKFVACGDIDGQCLLYDLEQQNEEANQSFKSSLRANMLNHGKGVKCIKFSQDTSMLITGGEDLHINMVDVQTQKRVLTLVNHADWITSISFNPADPRYFASTSLDGTVKIWKQGTNKEVKTVAFNGNGGIWKADFTPDGKFMGVCCQDGTIGLVSFVN